MVVYIIKSFIAIGILYLYYLLALKNKKFHSYNRFYLLLSVVISLIIPLIDFSPLYIETSPNAPLNHWVETITPLKESEAFPAFTTVGILFSTSIAISILFILLLSYKIKWIYAIKQRATKRKMKGFTFIETDVKQAPFSFLNNLFWKQGLSIQDENGKKIFRHELTHITQKHSYDKLFTQTVLCIFWMNPIYWLVLRELNTIHEFIADEACIKDGDAASFASMLLYSYNEGSYLSPLHPFFNSYIKRRLVMITTSKQPPYSYLRKILALPLILIIVAVLSISVKAQTTSKKEKQARVTIETTEPVKKQPPTVNLKEFKVKKKYPKTIRTKKGEHFGVIVEKEENASAEVEVIDEKLIETPVEEVTVTGYKIQDGPIEEVRVAGEKIEQPVEEVTVTGYKRNKKTGEVITVKGQKTKTRPVKTTVVSGYKKEPREVQ